MLERLVTHPNVGAALVLTFDRAAAAALESRLSDAGRPWRVLAMMDAQGMEDAVARSQTALSELDTLRALATRSCCELAELTLALECGGSDTTSALAANPVIGHLVDRVVSSGGRAIVSETAEFIGAEDIVRARAATPEIGAAITDCIARTERIMAADGESYRGVNPTRENIEAGLTTLVEKSMGAVAKTGRAPFAGCLEFAEPPQGPGLHFMDTPFFTPVSLTGMVAAGAQIVLFALGVFNPGGAPLAPTVRLSGNARTLADWGRDRHRRQRRDRGWQGARRHGPRGRRRRDPDTGRGDNSGRALRRRAGHRAHDRTAVLTSGKAQRAGFDTQGRNRR